MSNFIASLLFTSSLALVTQGEPCLSDPCQNGGTCLTAVTADPYFCVCPDGFTGSQCNETEEAGSGLEEQPWYNFEDTRYNDASSGPCVPNPCQNGGLCNVISLQSRGDVFSEYTCECRTGFQGVHCQTNVNECSSRPCRNGGLCLDLEGDYTCNCPSPYLGKSCHLRCSSVLGMEGGSIEDTQITASSTHLGFLGLKRWRPELARLNNKGMVNAWSKATFDQQPWIQVNLQRKMHLTGIITQGASCMGTPEFIKMFKVSYSTDGVEFTIFKGYSKTKAKLFTGNRDNNHQRKNLFDPPILAQYIRLVPIVCQRACTLRMELLGCELNVDLNVTGCSEALGMKSRLIKDEQVTASSTDSLWGMDAFTWRPSLARLDNSGKTNAWTSRTCDRSQWLQVDLLTPKKISGVITQGAKDFGKVQYVQSFKIAHSFDGKSWSVYKDNTTNIDKIFEGNYDNNSHKRNMFERPFFARFLRVLPWAWYHRITLRLELLGCNE